MHSFCCRSVGLNCEMCACTMARANDIVHAHAHVNSASQFDSAWPAAFLFPHGSGILTRAQNARCRLSIYIDMHRERKKKRAMKRNNFMHCLESLDSGNSCRCILTMTPHCLIYFGANYSYNHIPLEPNLISDMAQHAPE